jgi:hypothetical protein
VDTEVDEDGEAYSAGQLKLFQVLKAFALHRPDIGYCQVRRRASHTS